MQASTYRLSAQVPEFCLHYCSEDYIPQSVTATPVALARMITAKMKIPFLITISTTYRECWILMKRVTMEV